VVLGIPSNDFGGQTPEGEKEVKNFCQKKYGVSFPLTRKTVVTGPNKSPLFKYLTGNQEVAWNFEKFIISPEGKVTKRFRSSMRPLDPKIRSEIEGFSK
jgi:glutathione peroxidase